jgi:hypothetical protein
MKTRPNKVKDTAMSPLAHALIDPFVGTIAFLAVMGLVMAATYLLIEKTGFGTWLKSKTPWMCWYNEEAVEDEYTNFRIHPSNYIKVPSNH